MMFALGETTRLLFETIHEDENLLEGVAKFTWIGPDSWVNGPSALPRTTSKASYMEHFQGRLVAVVPLLTNLGPRFDKFFTGYQTHAAPV